MEGNLSPIVNQWEYFWETTPAKSLDEPENLNLEILSNPVQNPNQNPNNSVHQSSGNPQSQTRDSQNSNHSPVSNDISVLNQEILDTYKQGDNTGMGRYPCSAIAFELFMEKKIQKGEDKH